MSSLSRASRRRLAGAALGLALTAVPACSATGTTAPRSPAARTSVAAAPVGSARQPARGETFLAIVNPSVALGSRLDNQLQDMLPAGSGLQAATLMFPWVDAIERTQFQVAGVSWPPQVTNDLTRWLLDDAAVANDIRGVLYIPAGDLAVWYRQEAVDVAAAGAARSVVRADLGVSPTS